MLLAECFKIQIALLFSSEYVKSKQNFVIYTTYDIFLFYFFYILYFFKKNATKLDEKKTYKYVDYLFT